MTVKELVYLIQKPGFEVADLQNHEVLIRGRGSISKVEGH